VSFIADLDAVKKKDNVSYSAGNQNLIPRPSNP
jgi:hypothetical protein